MECLLQRIDNRENVHFCFHSVWQSSLVVCLSFFYFQRVTASHVWRVSVMGHHRSHGMQSMKAYAR